MKATTWQKVRAHAAAAEQRDEQDIAVLKAAMLSEVRAYKLAQLRQEAGLSQQELAKQLQVSQSRISRIEHGDLDKTELATLRKFIQALGGELELSLKLGDERFVLG